jgi:hypothetical protein
MPLSEKQAEERRLRKAAAAERESRRLVLVERNGWFGVYSSQDSWVELISRDEAVARKALVALRKEDPNWRDV